MEMHFKIPVSVFKKKRPVGVQIENLVVPCHPFLAPKNVEVVVQQLSTNKAIQIPHSNRQIF